MYILKNEQLSVSILDPVADVAREGSRYCNGGYLWQVNDAEKGELLSGPEFPKEPNTFDGQGMPDMFFRPLGGGNVPMGGLVGCIGVGQVPRTSEQEPFDVRYNRTVAEFLPWSVEQHDQQILMGTEHTFRDWHYRIERSVALEGRSIRSRTTLHNLGTVTLPVVWFAHPFFPIPADNVLCKFSIPVEMPENPGYFLRPDGFVQRKPDHDWKTGWYQPLAFPKESTSLRVVQKHPKVGEVTVETDFLPGFLPIWGNDRTFSFEPYFMRDLTAGEVAAWQITYTF